MTASRYSMDTTSVDIYAGDFTTITSWRDPVNGYLNFMFVAGGRELGRLCLTSDTAENQLRAIIEDTP